MRRISAPMILCGCLWLAGGGCAPPESGDPGTAGTTGSAGTTGAAGTTGSAGTTGAAGDSGSAGTTGAAGTTGVAGTTGSAGTTGGAGTTGAAGTTGGAGTTGTGGGSAGTTGRGGSGQAGTTGMAGTTGTAGTTGSAGTTGAGGSGTSSCTITPSVTMSSRIPTVGIVTFTTSMSNVMSGTIDFGLTTAYGMTAPIDVAAQSYRTLLLGMKGSRMYNYRITIRNSSGQECQSGNLTLMSGAVANGFQKPTLTPATATGLAGGFLITGQYQGAGASRSAYIIDADGDYVWWYSIGSDVTGARMSYDGKHMWINNANVPGPSGGRVRRVTMDGMTEDNYDTQFARMNHQIAILPDETVAFYAYGDNGCDDVRERAPNGTMRTIVNSKTALMSNASMCHLNNIQYSPEDDTLVFSNLQSNQLAKVRRDNGQTVWILNGSGSYSGVTWTGGNHGIHMLGLDRLIFFHNNSSAGSAGSIAQELILNNSARTVMKGWSYTASPGIANMVMGDVQKMPNGNVIVGYSTRGELHEVSSSGTRLQRWQWPSGATFGYIEKRLSLYGPPPR